MSIDVDWYLILKRQADLIEKKFDLKLTIDLVTIDEIDEMAKKTLASFNQNKPSVAKVAGNVAFWIKKLKPLNRASDSSNDYRVINELAAVLVGAGICNTLGHRSNVEMSAQMLNDLVSSLRYHSYSPNSVAMIFESLMR